MPFITIKSLPFEKPLDINSLLKGLSNDFSQKTGIDLEHISATWEYYEAGQYIVGGICKQFQPQNSHPILVEILTPDFNGYETIEVMILAVASCLAKQTGVSENNIFVNCNLARSGMVFDGGKIVTWSPLP